MKMLQHSDIALAIAVVMVLVTLIIPIPPFLLDVLLTVNIAFAMITLLVTLSTGGALEFSTFPSLLLFATLFRLALNVASTRLILLDGAAGQVITAFGDFVVGGNLVVGIVVFLILVIIQFVVITKGATRISEVAARFTLDAMPGKQMAIDADLNAGLISEEQARDRRATIAQEAEFYGAMDGASKFVRGDAIAGIFITLVNLFGGVVIGMMNGSTIQGAVRTYSSLTVGDGLVSQIPSLIIATASAIIITKAATRADLSREMVAQVLRNRRPLGIATVILLLFAIMPGMPKVPFIAIAMLLGALYYICGSDAARPAFASSGKRAHGGAALAGAGAQGEQAAGPAQAATPPLPEKMQELTKVDRMSIEVGFQLVPVVDPKSGSGLLEKISSIRRNFAREMGLVVPPIRIKDDMKLAPQTYVVRIRGQEIGRFDLKPDHFLAMDAGAVSTPIPGEAATEPAFGLPALWIPESQKDVAELAGYAVIDGPTLIVTHLSELIKRHAYEILSREDTKELVEHIKKENAAVVDELLPNMVTIGTIQRVLQALLRERVPIVDLPAILEAIADHAHIAKDPEVLTEFVRGRIARTICSQFSDDSNTLQAITLDPVFEQQVARSVTNTNALGIGQGSMVALDPDLAQAFVEQLAETMKSTLSSPYDTVLLSSAAVRRHIRSLVAPAMPDLPVISYNELVPSCRVEARACLAVTPAASHAA